MYRFISYSVILVLVSLLMACQDQKQNNVNEQKLDTLSVNHDDKNINSIGVILSAKSKQEVERWPQYLSFSNNIENYLVISNDEALNNAKLLKNYADSLKLSMPPGILYSEELKARVNILNSECSRLADMSNIPSITEQEVKNQIKQVLSVYSMLNSKINAVYDVYKLQSELNLDPDFGKMLNDVPKPVSDTATINKLEPIRIKNRKKKS